MEAQQRLQEEGCVVDINEDGDDDGDVDEDDHRGDDSPSDGTPAPPREGRRGSPPCALIRLQRTYNF